MTLTSNSRKTKWQWNRVGKQTQIPVRNLSVRAYFA